MAGGHAPPATQGWGLLEARAATGEWSAPLQVGAGQRQDPRSSSNWSTRGLGTSLSPEPAPVGGEAGEAQREGQAPTGSPGPSRVGRPPAPVWRWPRVGPGWEGQEAEPASSQGWCRWLGPCCPAAWGPSSQHFDTEVLPQLLQKHEGEHSVRDEPDARRKEALGRDGDVRASGASGV